VGATLRSGRAPASQPAGFNAGVFKSARKLRFESVVSASEYGSVTRLRTMPTPRTNTSTK